MIIYDSKGNDFDNKNSTLTRKDILALKSDVFRIAATLDGLLFDPRNVGHNMSKKDRLRGGYFFQLRKCSENCFSMYVNFLKTRNTADLIIAQRRFKDEY